MVLEIDGKNILPYIQFGGIKFKRNDIDGPNAGRTLDGVMHRDRVGSKITIEVTCRTLTTLQARYILKLLEPEFFKVRVTHPLYGEIEKTMYTNNVPTDLVAILRNGYAKWGGIKFNLIEK